MFAVLGLLLASCSTLPEDPRTWENFKSTAPPKVKIVETKKLPFDPYENTDGIISHPIHSNNGEEVKKTNTL